MIMCMRVCMYYHVMYTYVLDNALLRVLCGQYSVKRLIEKQIYLSSAIFRLEANL